MSRSRGMMALQSALVCTGLLLVSARASASPHGFHEFLKHEQTVPMVLPPLYEPVPTHVPVLSNSALIRLWETNQYSPILRNAAIERQLCEAVTEQRDLNPTRFDALHPTLGRLLSDRAFFAYALNLYATHTARFVHYHHSLIPVIRGFYLMTQTEGQVLQGVIPTTTTPTTSTPTGPNAAPEGIQNTPPPPAPFAVQTPAPQSLVIQTPAPQSLVMLSLGLAAVALVVSVHRRIRLCLA